MSPEALKLRADNNLAQLSEQEQGTVRSLVNTSVNDARNTLHHLDLSHPRTARLLEVALDWEKTHTPRLTILTMINSALKKATTPQQLPIEAIAVPAKRKASKTETATVVPKPAVILASAVKSMEKLRVALGKQEDAFWAATLGARLQIGLQCLKAYQVFVIKDHKERGARKGKKLVTRDELLEGGFEGWLLSDASWLKKPTAYKYMTAVRGLGLDHDATEKQVAAALKLLQRKGPVTLQGLCAAAPALIEKGDGGGGGGGTTQTEFEFLRDGLADFRKQAEALLALKTQLHENPDMERVASARVYGLLYQLTGTHWKPSDEPDDLANVNPDSIEL